MVEYINGNLVREIIFRKKKKDPYWEHKVGVSKFLWWKNSYDYWKFWLDTYTEKEMVKELPKYNAYLENGVVYYKPHVILKFSKEHDICYYFDTVEEAEDLINKFLSNYPNTFYKIEY